MWWFRSRRLSAPDGRAVVNELRERIQQSAFVRRLPAPRPTPASGQPRANMGEERGVIPMLQNPVSLGSFLVVVVLSIAPGFFFFFLGGDDKWLIRYRRRGS